MRMNLFGAILVLLSVGAAAADPPVVVDAEARPGPDGWRFSVTLSHPDTGWDHYADGWEVRTTEGESLGLRELAHPHVEEQPFTRSLSGVRIPAGVDVVHIRARCNVDGWSEEAFILELPSDGS